ncbi:methionine ABC transporter ATP-binding protein [Macrococcoides caseolyticum]|uniref:methionine ABC transporter ATP-binding protein n=1 Tax=Macrococcoides caseolyticum TaxID=69966 RepID=UPI001F3AC82D|nr:ATP-binding cassette domain-containing protein [Macrococcus caseolyticus]MCE4955808.1 ATP-binding cassette domain-containing protein [Macrococcus caseolyticus]
MITLNQVVKTFTTKKGNITAVDNVSLEIQSGEIYGIIGFSGAGKSTLIRMFNGLELPTRGDIVVNGSVINQLTRQQLNKERQKISMIFQHFNLLWSRTVFDNIALPLEIAGVNKRDIQPKVQSLIKLVGLEGRENAYPSELSGGQKQRVGIARALSNDPKVLLCDEATSALDPQTTDEILELLVDINKQLNLTIVLITHEMEVIRKICHKVAVMEAGKVVEEGSVIEVFNHPKTAITKRFVKDDIQDSEIETSIEEIKAAYPHGSILRLKFVGSSTGQPIVSKVIKKYGLEMNILAGNVKHTQGGSFGNLIVHVEAVNGSLQPITEELKLHGVEMEVERHG